MFPTTGNLAQACYNVYETRDGQWLALGALETKFWNGFCERAGIPPTAGEDDVRRVLRTRTRAEWLEQFAGADVCLTEVHTPLDAGRDPHLLARAATPGSMASARPAAAPALGADTDAILDAAGIDAAARAALRARGTI
jgi:alpha-methylacyl-CoA racemase